MSILTLVTVNMTASLQSIEHKYIHKRCILHVEYWWSLQSREENIEIGK